MATKHYKILARHKWVQKTTLAESIQRENRDIRRFTATICGWKNWKLYEGRPFPELSQLLFDKMVEIRDKIEAGDKAIFEANVEINK